MIEWRESMRICALHFPEGWITEDGKLHDEAKPSIFKTGTTRRKMELYV